ISRSLAASWAQKLVPLTRGSKYGLVRTASSICSFNSLILLLPSDGGGDLSCRDLRRLIVLSPPRIIISHPRARLALGKRGLCVDGGEGVQRDLGPKRYGTIYVRLRSFH